MGVNILAPEPPANMMRHFDALPSRLRQAMAFADFPYDPREIAERLAKGRRADVLARAIEKKRTL